jgi:hypothetical protein
MHVIIQLAKINIRLLDPASNKKAKESLLQLLSPPLCCNKVD